MGPWDGAGGVVIAFSWRKCGSKGCRIIAGFVISDVRRVARLSVSVFETTVSSFGGVDERSKGDEECS